jgi:FSR family fosmidomycin resistance protein-like MFS transporter
LSRSSKSWQWVQLAALAFVHFYVDLFAGMIPALLPKIREEFILSLARAGWLLAVMKIASNGMQIATGPMRARQNRMLFLPLGLILGSAGCLMYWAPRTGTTEFWLYLMIIVSGCGIAVVHPEGLRATHALDRISGSVSTAFFLMGGFLGYAAGGLVGTILVKRWGLEGLWGLIPPALLGAGVLYCLRIRLAVEEHKEENAATLTSESESISIWPIFFMAIPAAISAEAIMWMVPARLKELGFELTMGGFSGMLFVLGGVAGNVTLALLAAKRNKLLFSAVSYLLGIPLLLIYVNMVDSRQAPWVLMASGLFLIAPYALLVTIARYSRGFNLGGRMALMVGGTWGTAGLAVPLMSKMAEYMTVQTVLNWVWTGFAISGMVGIWILIKQRGKKPC